MNAITAPINFALVSAGGDDASARAEKRLAIDAFWNGDDATDGETDFTGVVSRANALLSATGQATIACPTTPWGVAGPLWNNLNNIYGTLASAVGGQNAFIVKPDSVFSDTGGETPAVVGETVAAFRSLDGELFATQATEAQRPRYGRHPASGLRNQVPNNIGAGAVVGVVGSGGALPDIMFTNNISGREIVAVNEAEGWIDLRLFGTPTGTANVFFYGATTIRAATDQTWVASTGLAITGGDLTNISNIQQTIFGRDAGGTLIAQGSSADIKSSLSATVARFAYSRTLTEAGVGRVSHSLQIANTGAIDITLRIQLTQMEQGSTPSGIQRASAGGLNVVEAPFRQVSYLKPDGIDDFMTLSTAFEPAGNYSMAAAVFHTAGDSDSHIGSTGGNARFGPGNGLSFAMWANSADNRTTAVTLSHGRAVYVGRVSAADAPAEIWQNGTAMTPTLTGLMQPVATGGFDVLFRAGSAYAKGRFYGGAMLPSAITDTQRQIADRALAYASGVTL